jgi:AbrB family looped-hinge helix DNA binding protein
MKVTSKGQVTIPIEIRSLLGILPNSEVEFIEEGGKVELRKKAGSGKRGQQLVAAIRGKSSLKLSTDQIMALTRGNRPHRKKKP